MKRKPIQNQHIYIHTHAYIHREHFGMKRKPIQNNAASVHAGHFHGQIRSNNTASMDIDEEEPAPAPPVTQSRTSSFHAREPREYREGREARGETHRGSAEKHSRCVCVCMCVCVYVETERQTDRHRE
jgi:hypothetical protein